MIKAVFCEDLANNGAFGGCFGGGELQGIQNKDKLFKNLFKQAYDGLSLRLFEFEVMARKAS